MPDWEKATRYPLTIENLSNETVIITLGAVTMDGNRNDQDAGRFYSADGCPLGDPISIVTIPAGESRTFYYGAKNTSNSGYFKGSIKMEFSVKGVPAGAGRRTIPALCLFPVRRPGMGAVRMSVRRLTRRLLSPRSPLSPRTPLLSRTRAPLRRSPQRAMLAARSPRPATAAADQPLTFPPCTARA